MKSFRDFLETRDQCDPSGFAPTTVPDFLFPFQRELVEWAVNQGRAAIFADCGLGKTPMQLVWAQNVVENTNKPVVIATPLAVSHQVVAEGEKFGIPVQRMATASDAPDGAGVFVTNYERLHYFDPADYGGMVCDESSILKNFNGVRRGEITEFMRTIPYRLLCTATAAPNDYTELGTSSEALGGLGYSDMLTRFFRNARNNAVGGGRNFGKASEWRFKGHAEEAFWQWVSSWARAIRRPSDYGYDDDGFELPPLHENEHVMEADTLADGMLFNLPALNLAEQREERKRTIPQRCAKVAELVDHDEQALVWCHRNDEADLLESSIGGAVQVAGSDDDDEKERKLLAFARGELRVLVTKPKIGAWGLNLQNCAHATFFPSHSYEQYYQAVRRCWRFGQTRPVTVDIVATHGERRVIDSLKAKAERADQMFDSLMAHMSEAITIERADYERDYRTQMEVPAWL